MLRDKWPPEETKSTFVGQFMKFVDVLGGNGIALRSWESFPKA